MISATPGTEITGVFKMADEQAQQGKSWSSEIKKLGDAIVALTLMQAKELGDYLKDEYGIEPAGGGVVVAAGPAAAGEAAVEEKTAFDVILKAVGDKKIQVIKEVRALTGLGLKEAKDLVEGAPKPVKTGLTKDEAEAADVAEQLLSARTGVPRRRTIPRHRPVYQSSGPRFGIADQPQPAWSG